MIVSQYLCAARIHSFVRRCVYVSLRRDWNCLIAPCAPPVQNFRLLRFAQVGRTRSIVARSQLRVRHPLAAPFRSFVLSRFLYADPLRRMPCAMYDVARCSACVTSTISHALALLPPASCVVSGRV